MTLPNAKQSQSRRPKMTERAQQQLELHFPEVLAELLWRRKTNDGFTTVPRTLPIVMQAIDATSKGMPSGHSLFCLWSRAPDSPLVAVENPATFAAETGFTGERSVDTWRKRMRTLRDLGFILTKSGASGEFHYILLLNPNIAVEQWPAAGSVDTNLGSLSLLELDRTDIAKRRVSARWVVEPLDVVEHICLDIITRSVDLARDPFGLH